MVALDPRLADPLILALAAKRAKERLATTPEQVVVLRVIYEGTPWGDPPEEGPSYTYYVPPKASGGGA